MLGILYIKYVLIRSYRFYNVYILYIHIYNIHLESYIKRMEKYYGKLEGIDTYNIFRYNSHDIHICKLFQKSGKL